MPASGRASPCPAACGSISASRSRPIIRPDAVGQPALEDPIQRRHLGLPSATITLPQISKGIPSGAQNSSINFFAGRQFVALNEPGL